MQTLHEVDKLQLGVSADQLLERTQRVLGEGLGLAVKVSDQEWSDLFVDISDYLMTNRATVDSANNDIEED